MDTDFLTRSLSRLKSIHIAMRDAIAAYTQAHEMEHLSGVARKSDSDIIYRIDESCEAILLEHCEKWGKEESFILIAEGMESGGMQVFPSNSTVQDAEFRLIVDPIDGTRGIMYDKRSAWILSGIAPNHGPATTLADIELAIQTEVPLSKQYLADMLFSVRGRGTKGERMNLLTGASKDFYPRPSTAQSLEHGFAMLTKFFPGRKQITAAIEEELMLELGLLNSENPISVFDDQYVSTGGQFYELTMGHDRFSGDFRARLMQASGLAGNPPSLAAHPYDVCTELVAREAGVIITDINGSPLNAPLDVVSNVSWLAYANATLRQQIEPLLQKLLVKYNIL